MNILLPVSLCSANPTNNPSECRSAKHELYASNGCYTWEISHPHLISMLPSKVRGDCVDSVILQPLIHRESKTLIQIIAKDKSSGQVLESQAKVGLIDRLAININYRHFYINDKKHIQVVAYDEEGNIFSGLDGFRFDWTLTSGTEYLKIIQKPEGYIHKQADCTDVTFLKGLQAGSADLKVQILEPGYEHIKSVQVNILVIDPFIIEPQKQIFLCPTSQFKYNLIRLRKQDIGEVSRNPIKLPNSQYVWSISTPTFGRINQDGSFISGTIEGIQNILVVDQQMVNNTAETQLQVVHPYKIIMNIYDVTSQSGKVLNDSFSKVFGIEPDQPSMSNILVEDRLYLILLSLEDKDGNKITLTENLVFQSFSLLDQQWIEKVQVNQIGSEILFKTRKIDTQMKKMLTSYKLSQIKNYLRDEVYDFSQFAQHLNVEAELILTKPVKILHPTNLILLPYLHQEYSRQIWQTSAEGGSGVYQWSVDHPEVIQLEGSITLKAQNVGKTRLYVKDLRNHHNFQFIDVEVALITQLKWLEEQLELRAANSTISQGEKSFLHLIALDRQGRKFTNCTTAQFSYSTQGEGIIILPSQTNRKSFYSKLTQQLQEDEMLKLIALQQQFDENPNKVFVQELTNSVQMTKELMLYNNFGICSQVEIQGKNEGLSRLQAKQSVQDCGPDQKETGSEFAQIAVYQALRTSSPDLSLQFKDLYSKENQIGQEFTNFDRFYKNNLLTLLPGTEVTWQVVGGTNFWSDYSDKYNVEWIVTDLKDNSQNTKSLQISKQNEMITKFDIRIRCAQTQDLEGISQFKVTMLQNSKQSRNLLKPATHSVEVYVECGAPKSQRLLWSQSETMIESFLPKSRILNDERIHFALVNSNHTVKTILFDQAVLSYLNSSSAIQDVKSSDDKIATVSMSEQRFENAIKNDKYSKRLVQFNNQTGTVIITSTTLGYINSVLQKSTSSIFKSGPSDQSVWKLGEITSITPVLTDFIQVQVVHEVQIEPQFKSIYIGNLDPLDLTILEGSGFFSVKGDSSLADIIHKNRKIYITPKKIGLLVIEVVDIEIPNCKVVKAQILISEVEKIHLSPPYILMEQFDIATLTVTAFDSYGNQFDADQQSKMKFTIDTQSIGVKTEDTSINSVFRATGFEHGIYQLSASIKRTTNQNNDSTAKTISGMSNLQVFPQLEIFPNELLITPNMRYTLQIIGGPQNSSQYGYQIKTKFSVVDIAIVDQNEVTGIQVGDTALHYEIIQQKTQKVVCKKTIPIRVRLITDIEIPLTNQRQIFSESLIKMNVVLKYNQEYFNHGIAPISYSWNTTSKRILSLMQPKENLLSNNQQTNYQLRNNRKNDDNALFTTEFNSSTIYAIGGTVGEQKVTVQLAIEYPNKYRNEQNWFYQTALVKVVSHLRVQVNEYSTLQSSQDTHMYLIPPNSIAQLKAKTDTKLKLRYSIFSLYDHQTNQIASQEPTSLILKLVNNTAIQSFNKHGKVTVLVEQDDQFQSDLIAMLNVFITDIYSIQVMNTYDALNLPFDSTNKFPIHFLNDRAHRFANNIEGIKIGYSVSHPNVVSVSIDEFSQTLTIFGQGEGESNIFLYLKNQPDIFDVIKVRVSSLIQPLSPVYLHIGGEVEFRVLMKEKINDFRHQKSWLSNQTQVLQIGLFDGKAIGVSEGIAEVTLSDQITAPSIVQVSKITSGQIEQVDNFALSSAKPQLKIRVKMFFQNSDKEVMPTKQYKGVTLIRQNIGLNCICDYTEFVSVTSEVSDEGYFCLLKLKQIESQKTMPKNIKINVEAFGKLPDSSTPIYSQQIASFQVKLLRTLQVEPKYKDGFKLSSDQREANIQIFTSSDVDVQITGVKDIKYKITREDFYSNDYNLNIKVPEEIDFNFQANVVLTIQGTKQEVKIPFSFNVKNDQRQISEEQVKAQSKKRSSTEYIILTVVVFISIEFILRNWWNSSILVSLNLSNNLFQRMFRLNDGPQDQQQRRNPNLFVQKQRVLQRPELGGAAPGSMNLNHFRGRNHLNQSRISQADRSQSIYDPDN